MSVDMGRVDGVPGGGQCLLLWGAALERWVRSQPSVLFSSYALRRGSVRAARRFMRALSGKFVFHLPAPGAERAGPAPRTGTARSGRLIGTALGRRRPRKNSKKPEVSGIKILGTRKITAILLA